MLWSPRVVDNMPYSLFRISEPPGQSPGNDSPNSKDQSHINTKERLSPFFIGPYHKYQLGKPILTKKENRDNSE